MSKKRNYQGVYVGLVKEDFDQLDELAAKEETTKTDIARKAIRWYFDNQEQLKNRPRETEIAQSFKAMTDRVCGMLARQGAAIGTLYELTWMGLASEESKQVFEAAASKAKQKMRTGLSEDERVLTEKMKKVVSHDNSQA